MLHEKTTSRTARDYSITHAYNYVVIRVHASLRTYDEYFGVGGYGRRGGAWVRKQSGGFPKPVMTKYSDLRNY